MELEPQLYGGMDQDALDERDKLHILTPGGDLANGTSVPHESPFVPSVPNDVVSAQPSNISYNNSATASQYIISESGATLLAAKDEEISSLKAQIDEVRKKLEITEKENQAKEQKNSNLMDMFTSLNADMKEQKKTIKNVEEANRKLEETTKELMATNSDLDEMNRELSLQCTQAFHYIEAATNNMIRAHCQLASKFTSRDTTTANQAQVDKVVQDPSQLLTTGFSARNLGEAGTILNEEASTMPSVLNGMIDSAHENKSDVVNTWRKSSEDPTACPVSLNTQLPENGEPYNSQEGNAQATQGLSDTVPKNRGPHFPQQNQVMTPKKRERTETGDLEQDLLGEIKRPKNSLPDTVIEDPEVLAKEVQAERDGVNEQYSIDNGSQNTSHPDGTSPRVNLLGYNNREKIPDAIPATSTGGSLPLKERKSRDRHGKKPFDWKDHNLPYVKAVLKQLSEQSEAKLLEKAWNEYAKESVVKSKESLRNQFNNILRSNLQKAGIKKEDSDFKIKMKLMKENLSQCLPVIIAIHENTNESSALNTLLDKIKREDEAKNEETGGQGTC